METIDGGFNKKTSNTNKQNTTVHFAAAQYIRVLVDVTALSPFSAPQHPLFKVITHFHI